MRIFVHDNKTEGTIQQLCEQYDVQILNDETVKNTENLDPNVFFLDSVDALILEITKPTHETQFILAQALLAEKPLLCLYGKNQTPRRLIEYIQRKRTPRKVRTYGYMEKELSSLVDTFINRYDPRGQAEDEIPSLKFTMRLSPRNDRYIEWLTAQEQTTKAKVLRRIISAAEQLDDTYPHKK